MAYQEQERRRAPRREPRSAAGRWVAAVFVAFVALGAAHPAAANTSGGDEVGMRAERLASGERIVLDGSLAHPAWSRAPVFDRLVEFAPRNGSAARERTTVQVLFDDEALYIGVVAYDREPAAIRDVPVRHDGVIRTQDFVVAYVDPIGTKRSAQWFRVNAAGSKADGLHTASDDSEDFAPDFDWDAAVQRRPDGWSAVMRLPFASLRYDGSAAAAGRPWRFMLGRRLPREQFHLILSSPLRQGAPSFIDELHPLTGVELPPNASFLTLRPSLTLRGSDSRGTTGERARASAGDASLDVKWRPRAELVVDATLNPDFSQVALDVPQLAGNTRFALSLVEKRPFFFESADLWRGPTVALYTRSLTEPRGGLRGTWRSVDWAGTALAVQDRGGGFVLLPGPYGTGAAAQPGSDLLAVRARRDDGALHWGGVVASRRYEGGVGENTVLGPDLHWHLGEAWRLDAQWLHSRTSALPDATGELARGGGGAGVDAQDGDQLYLQLVRQTSSAETRLTLDSSDRRFRHDTGFINQAGVHSARLWQAFTWRGAKPFNDLTLNVEALDTRERGSGELVRRFVRPGLYATGARNLEWRLELYPRVESRSAPGAPVLAERYVSTGLVFSPGTWWTLLDTNLDWGDLADTSANRVRRGMQWRTSGKLRPLRALEVEPSVLLAWLRPDDGEGLTYRESAMQWLAVWHFDAQHTLRLITQQRGLDRRAEAGIAAERSRAHTESLTYAWRRSTGTVVYVGATRAAPADGSRRTEAFVKLQADVGELRSAWW
jgi:hypothetical protein